MPIAPAKGPTPTALAIAKVVESEFEIIKKKYPNFALSEGEWKDIKKVAPYTSAMRVSSHPADVQKKIWKELMIKKRE